MEEYNVVEYAVGSIKNRNRVVKMDPVSSIKFNKKTECYVSLFCFNEELIHFVKLHKSVKDYTGKHLSNIMFFDFDDNENPDNARIETIRFADYLIKEYEVPSEYLQFYFSGQKGFHLTIPLQAFTPSIQAHVYFYKMYKSIALEISKGFKVDQQIYDIRRLIRVPNSLHGLSGLYKIPLTYDELKSLTIEQIKVLAANRRFTNHLPDSEIKQVKKFEEIYDKWLNYDFTISGSPQLENSSFFNPEATLLEGVNKGIRHSSLTKIVGVLLSRNLDKNWIVTICLDWNRRNKPPLKKQELITQVNDMLKRYNPGTSFIEFEICLLSLPGTPREILLKIICHCVKNHGAHLSLISGLGVEDCYVSYCEECSVQINIFNRYGKLVYARIGYNFLLSALNGDIKFETFCIYVGIVSCLGRKKRPPQPISNSRILYRSKGFKNKSHYDDFCSTFGMVKLPTDYMRRKSLELLRSTGMKMFGMASLKQGSLNYYSTYFNDQAILHFLIEREKRIMQEKYKYKEIQDYGQEELKKYKINK